MKLKQHRLIRADDIPYTFRESGNVSTGLDPRYLVIHYTASPNAQHAIDWLADPQAKASAHVVIARDGTITQLVPFDRVAWHAGASRWEGLQGLNRYSIGIELDNGGKLSRRGGKWQSWFGGSFPDEEVLEAVHKHGGPSAGWHIYTPEQIEAAAELSSLLVQQYGLLDVIGHEDISPGRKTDPGPAFPMESFRARIMGRRDERLPEYVVTEELNIRTGPGAQYDTIAGGPLPEGTRVEVLAEQGSWRRVEVLHAVNGHNDLEGWVHGRYLRRA